jgi:hypothetical protein
VPKGIRWQEVRCRGCQRILFELSRGMVRKRVHKRGDNNDELIIYGQPAVATCGGCGAGWINPDMVADDGLGAVVARAISTFRERADRPDGQAAA